MPSPVQRVTRAQLVEHSCEEFDRLERDDHANHKGDGRIQPVVALLPQHDGSRCRNSGGGDSISNSVENYRTHMQIVVVVIAPDNNRTDGHHDHGDGAGNQDRESVYCRAVPNKPASSLDANENSDQQQQRSIQTRNNGRRLGCAS